MCCFDFAPQNYNKKMIYASKNVIKFAHVQFIL